MYSRADILKHEGFFRTFTHYPVHDEWKQELYNYFILGFPPGSFHTSCFCNDLSGAVHRSHISNTWEAIQMFMRWVQANAPSGSWGSRKEVEEWLSLSDADRRAIYTKQWHVLTDAEVTFKLLEEA